MTPIQSNPSPEVVADRLAAYLTDTLAGRERLACFEQGDLVRRVFVNAATWQPWIDGKKDPNRRPTGVRRDGAQVAIDRLHEAEPQQRGTHWIARPDLLELARDAEGRVGRSALFTAVMMWGSGTTNGRGPRYTATALADARLDAVLARTREQVLEGNLVDAHGAFRIRGVGQSFFTKWFWACTLGHEVERRPLILDERVIETVNLLDWRFYLEGPNKRVRYGAFVDTAESWAVGLRHRLGTPNIDAEKIEWLLFERPESDGTTASTLRCWLLGRSSNRG